MTKSSERAINEKDEFSNIEKDSTTLKKVKQNPRKLNEKLDNFARVLEGASGCTAVCLFNNELLITNNKLTDTKEERIKNLYERYVDYLKKRNENEIVNNDERNSLFEELAIERIKAEKGYISIKSGLKKLPKKDEEMEKEGRDIKNIKNIASIMLTEHNQWRKQKVGDIGQNFNGAIPRSGYEKQIVSSHFILERLAHDFKESERYLSNNDNFINAKCCIVTDSGTQNKTDNTHAELRIVNHIFDKIEQESSKEVQDKNQRMIDSIKKFVGENGENKIYIGISKLCCLNCDASIKAVNTVLSNEITALNDKNFIEYIIGSEEKTHGMAFEGNWKMPSFMIDQNAKNTVGHQSIVKSHPFSELAQQIGKKYSDILSKLEAQEPKGEYASQHEDPSYTSKSNKNSPFNKTGSEEIYEEILEKKDDQLMKERLKNTPMEMLVKEMQSRGGEWEITEGRPVFYEFLTPNLKEEVKKACVELATTKDTIVEIDDLKAKIAEVLINVHNAVEKISKITNLNNNNINKDSLEKMQKYLEQPEVKVSALSLTNSINEILKNNKEQSEPQIQQTK